MTALTHAVVVSLPDNPAYEVSKNAWNQAHPLPGTIGQLFASDGASGVDAIPQLVYNSTTGSFNVAVDSALGGVFQIFDVQGTRGMFTFDPNAGNLSADKLMPVTALSGLLDLGGPANLWKNLYLSDGLILGSIPAITDTGASIATFLRGDGSWAAVMAGSMTGAATEVLVSDGAGNAAGSADFTFDDATNTLTLGAGVDGALVLGATPFTFSESSSGILQLGSDKLNIDTNTASLDATQLDVRVKNLLFGSLTTTGASNGSQMLVDGGYILWDDGNLVGTPIAGIFAQDGNPDAVLLVDHTFDGNNKADLGASNQTVRRGYFGTELRSPLFSVASGAGNSGITTTITSASLVGKTITIQGGIITGFA